MIILWKTLILISFYTVDIENAPFNPDAVWHFTWLSCVSATTPISPIDTDHFVPATVDTVRWGALRTRGFLAGPPLTPNLLFSTCTGIFDPNKVPVLTMKSGETVTV
jgi:hypothetical protein